MWGHDDLAVGEGGNDAPSHVARGGGRPEVKRVQVVRVRQGRGRRVLCVKGVEQIEGVRDPVGDPWARRVKAHIRWAQTAQTLEEVGDVSVPEQADLQGGSADRAIGPDALVDAQPFDGLASRV